MNEDMKSVYRVPIAFKNFAHKTKNRFHLERIEIRRLSLSCLMHYFICTDAIKCYLPSSRFRPELVEDDHVISYTHTFWDSSHPGWMFWQSWAPRCKSVVSFPIRSQVKWNGLLCLIWSWLTLMHTTSWSTRSEANVPVKFWEWPLNW